jgi:hypothetical protein
MKAGRNIGAYSKAVYATKVIEMTNGFGLMCIFDVNQTLSE